ncbi:MAG: helix-turn-helix transcriptional regulator [Planctomycetes bacterium]|nr:helix-turn-helix transcriptional regulator [Planctomycetota bacterium]
MIVHVRQSIPHAPREATSQRITRSVMDTMREATHHAERDGCSPSGMSLDPIVSEAVRLIHETIGQPPRVPQIAQQLGVSQRSLNRWFRQELGCTVVQVIRDTRLAYARQWLATRPNLPVTQIAAIVGYSSPNRMENHFQETLGVSPREYRRQIVPVPPTLESPC